MESNIKMIDKPGVFAPFKALSAGQSTRHGGVSPAPWQSLNLGKSTDDDPANVAENRRRFCTAMGFEVAQLAWSRQVHGDQIRVVTVPGGSEGFDALVTNVPGILLAVSVADCTPILIYDSEKAVVTAIHAGWRGTAARLVSKTLELMAAQFGCCGKDCYAYVGTCIDECSFEVGDEVAEAFDVSFKRFDTQRQKYFVDLKKANATQCLAFGIPKKHLEISPSSTVLQHEDYFSHRFERGVTGRMLAAIGMRSGA